MNNTPTNSPMRDNADNSSSDPLMLAVVEAARELVEKMAKEESPANIMGTYAFEKLETALAALDAKEGKL